MTYSPYTPYSVTPTQNQQADFTVSVSSGNTPTWTHTGPPTNTLGSNMSGSFVNDTFVEVKVPGSTHPLYQRMSQNEMTGAQLHPLLKKVVDEANSLDRENKDLKSKIDGYISAIKSTDANTVKLEILKGEKADLERRLANQQHNITELQLELVELHDAHDALRQVIRDYSEDSVNEIVQDYQAQLAHYEGIIQDYERAGKITKPGYPTTTLEEDLTMLGFFSEPTAAVTEPVTNKTLAQATDESHHLHYSQDQVDRMIEDAKLELIAKQDASVSHEDKMINIGPGVKVWQLSTGAGPFWTQTPKTYRHTDKEKTTSLGWLVHTAKGKVAHFPIGDLTDKEPIRREPNKLAHVMVYGINAVAMQLVAAQSFGLKAVIPMTIAQTLVAAFTYRDVFKAN